MQDVVGAARDLARDSQDGAGDLAMHSHYVWKHSHLHFPVGDRCVECPLVPVEREAFAVEEDAFDRSFGAVVGDRAELLRGGSCSRLLEQRNRVSDAFFGKDPLRTITRGATGEPGRLVLL